MVIETIKVIFAKIVIVGIIMFGFLFMYSTDLKIHMRPLGHQKELSINYTLETKTFLPSRQKATHLLTLFTTFKNDSKRFNIHKNVVNNWARLKPLVQPVYFNVNTDPELLQIALDKGWLVLDVPRVNDVGTPFLKEMFGAVQKNISSTFYGFSNGDILYDYGCLKTLEAVGGWLQNVKQALVVGRRVNYIIKEQELHTFTDVINASKTGTLFADNAQDYFFIANNDFPWDAIKDVVIGRPGYDNYLVKMAAINGIAVVDATKTILALHQTGADGNFAGHHNNIDRNYNVDTIGKFQYHQGTTSSAAYETRFGPMGDLQIWKREIIKKSTKKRSKFFEKRISRHHKIYRTKKRSPIIH